MQLTIIAGISALMLLASPALPRRLRCGPDSVGVGPTCVDRYEASVWRIPPENVKLISKVQLGRATLADLLDGGATQVGPFPQPTQGCPNGDDTYGAGFPITGNWTERLYAASVAGVLPSTCITWLQAEQACRLSGKRLLSNQEWQAAAQGTPDPGAADDGVTTCNTNAEELISPGTVEPQYAMPTGSRSACVSNWGTHDMIGNVWEWVADWTSFPSNCTNWPGAFGDDISCVGSLSTTPTPIAEGGGDSETMPEGSAHDVPTDAHLPTVYSRGGNMVSGTRNGIFAIFAGGHPRNVSRSTGFRCGR